MWGQALFHVSEGLSAGRRWLWDEASRKISVLLASPAAFAGEHFLQVRHHLFFCTHAFCPMPLCCCRVHRASYTKRFDFHVPPWCKVVTCICNSMEGASYCMDMVVCALHCSGNKRAWAPEICRHWRVLAWESITASNGNGMQVMEWTQQMLVIGESFSSAESATLRDALARQSGKFFEAFHAGNMQVLATLVLLLRTFTALQDSYQFCQELSQLCGNI